MAEPAEPHDPRALALRAAPPLAILAALAALIDLAINRVAVRASIDFVEPIELLSWMRFGGVFRNLTGIAGVFALFAALSTYLRMPGFAPLYVRLPVAGFAGILMPPLTLALTLPRERLMPLLVLFGMFAGNVLNALFGGVAFNYRNRWLKAASALVVTTAILALIVVSIASVRALISGFGGPVAWISRNAGELTWFLVPLAMVPAAVPRSRDEWPAWVVGGVVMGAMIAVAIAGQRTLPPHYGTIIYGAFRVAALPEAGTIVYVLVVAIGLSGAASALASRDPWRRQLGAAIALWIAGGYAGRSPIQILDAVLAVVLLTRAAQAADPEGLRRAALRWGQRVVTGDPVQEAVDGEGETGSGSGAGADAEAESESETGTGAASGAEAAPATGTGAGSEAGTETVPDSAAGSEAEPDSERASRPEST